MTVVTADTIRRTQAHGTADIDGHHLANALRAAIHRVLAQTDHLNKINVFPVPDGDTGTNLSMTLSAVLAAIDRDATSHAGELLERIADTALDGARGNSGAILAQFLLGLADRAGQEPQLRAQVFAEAVTAGASYAREAMSQPKEGTLLSVLRDFGASLQASLRANPAHTVHELLRATQPGLRKALEATTTQLEALRAAHVVDAGAQGFVHLVDGMLHYLDTGEVGIGTFQPPHDAGAEPMADDAFSATQPHLRERQPRWCTECLIAAPEAGSRLDLRRLREALAPLGNSLVVGGTPRKARIHLHTDDPEGVFNLAGNLGTVTGQKADDMYRQTRAAHHTRTQRVAIVTDSAADIPEELIDELGIHVVPLRIHFGTRSYLDKVTMSPAEFYAELARNPQHPKTSQPPPGDFRRMYEFLASHYDHVVSISVTATASGTYSAAVSAAQRLSNSKDGRAIVTVIDSRSVSCGQGLVAVAAAECARAGGSIDDVLAAAESARARTCGFALLTNLDYAVRGGRVPPIARSVANLLRLSIVLLTRADGQVKPGGALLGRNEMERSFARFAIRHTGKRLAHADGNALGRAPSHTYRIVIGHGASRMRAEILAEALHYQLGPEVVARTWVMDMGTALGVHGGPDALILGLQRNMP